jgi:hypothetical protein
MRTNLFQVGIKRLKSFNREIIIELATKGIGNDRIIFSFDNAFDADMCYIRCVDWAKYFKNAFNVQIDGNDVICYKGEDWI